MAKQQPARPATKPAPDHDLPDPRRERTLPVRVRATRDGYYDNKYRRTGDVFTIAPAERPAKWMELVDPETPEHTTSHGEALKDQRNEVMAQRQAERAGGGVQAPIDNPDDGLDPIGAREG